MKRAFIAKYVVLFTHFQRHFLWFDSSVRRTPRCTTYPIKKRDLKWSKACTFSWTQATTRLSYQYTRAVPATGRWGDPHVLVKFVQLYVPVSLERILLKASSNLYLSGFDNYNRVIALFNEIHRLRYEFRLRLRRRKI